MPHDKVGNQVYKYREVIKDIATRFQSSFALTDKTASQMAKVIQKIYNDLKCSLSWPKVLIVDKGTKFMGECRDLLLRHGVRIQYAKFKRSVAITERDHQEFEKHAFFRQDAVDLHLPLTDRSRVWVIGLCINDDKHNDSLTKLIRMSPNKVIKRAIKGGKIIARPSVKHRKPVGYNEPLLSNYTKVRHLLESGELEGGKRRVTDCNWSPEVLRLIHI
ncbi:hypothetical protein RhiirC2_719458 [Rhizophagus irregularis]|uniref:Integrase catalytic domain-containing protein n=1 Tax=Rhizophagus irregularis TaxID=588596 RepID=A0A2N1ME83_9GLOM|nr:hypothetical protein RhiirC2_719458 [Rhizophagus irregularis]